MSFGFSSLGILLMMAVQPGGTPNDIVSWIKPEDYFQARDIDLNTAEMLRLAGAEPKSAKASFQQLLALRWLAEHPAELKKEKEGRKLLEALAAGKNGDALGFAREYAAAALAVLDGKTPAARAMPENSVKVDGLSWFPEKSAFFGAFDLRSSPDSKVPSDDSLRNFGQRALLLADTRVRNEIYAFADALGNVRLDRISFAIQVDPSNSRQNKIYIRFTGLGDRARLAEFLQNNFKGATAKEEKGPKGEAIVTIEQERKPPVFVLIGDNDLIMAGYASEGPNPELAKEVLAIRAAGKGSVASGPLADLLKQVPANATAVLAGQLPEQTRKEATGAGSQFPVLPERFLIDKTTGKATDIRWQGTFVNAEEAKSFSDHVAKLKEQASQGLKAVQETTKLKKETVELLTKTLEGVKTTADGKAVKGTAQVSQELPRAVVELVDSLLLMGKKSPGD